MAHTIRDKQKLLNRVRRIKGQVEAVEKAIDREQDCSAIRPVAVTGLRARNGKPDSTNPPRMNARC
jgi:DNA-binding FrmR family transcriptional regulator